MAGPWYVRSLAGTGGNGLSWATAAQSLTAVLALAVVAGDTIYVSDDHAETTAGSTGWTFPGTDAAPNYILCVDHTVATPGPTNLRTSATVTATGTSTVFYAGSFYCYGITWVANNGFQNCHAVSNRQIYDTNVFQLTNAGGCSWLPVYANGGKCEWYNTSIRCANALATFAANVASGLFVWRNSTAFVTGSTIPTTLWPINVNFTNTIVEGVDFSAKTSGTIVTTLTAGFFSFFGCRVAPGVTLASTPNYVGVKVLIANVDSGGTNYQLGQLLVEGSEATETTVVRTNGASDGITQVSRRITTTSNSSFGTPYISLPIDKWNTTVAAPVTAVLRGIWNSTTLPTNGQIWSEAAFLGTSSFPLVSYVDNNMANILSTPANLTADSTAWDNVALQVARSTPYVAGNVVKDSGNPGRLFFCTAPGTTSGTNPGYAGVTDGNTVTDGTVTFRAGVRFSLSLSLANPNLVGSVLLRIYVAAPSQTFWIDPLITAT